MKAILLAAGFGKRLMPLTKSKPKCLVEIKGKPILDIWIEKLINSGIKKILINLHYKKELVTKHIYKNKYRKNIELSFENKLLGTARTLIKNYNFYKSSEVMLIHADNYCLEDLNNFLRAHKKRPPNCLLTMMTFKTDNPKNCGILKLNNDGVVQKIFEKKKNAPGKIANGAVYILSRKFTLLLKNSSYTDFSTEVLPKFLGKIYTYQTYQPFLDIGTIKNFKKSQLL